MFHIDNFDFPEKGNIHQKLGTVYFFVSVVDIPLKSSSAFAGRMLPNPTGDGAYFIHGSDIWEIVCYSTACEWVEKAQKLNVEREAHVAMYIPSEMAICS